MAALDKGWYPSPTVPGRDQWWNGHAWTPQTRQSDPLESPPAVVPPAHGDEPGIVSGTLPFLVVGLVLSVVSLFFNPVFVLGLIGFFFSLAALIGVRETPNVAARVIMLAVAVIGILAGLAGSVIELIALVA